MLHTIDRTTQQHTTLRCIWMPAHTGVNAPLTAVWIETTQPDFPNQEDPDLSIDGQGFWPRAA